MKKIANEALCTAAAVGVGRVWCVRATRQLVRADDVVMMKSFLSVQTAVVGSFVNTALLGYTYDICRRG